MTLSPTLMIRNITVFFPQKSFSGMVQLIVKETVCHFIATLWDMHAVRFTLSYAIPDHCLSFYFSLDVLV